MVAINRHGPSRRRDESRGPGSTNRSRHGVPHEGPHNCGFTARTHADNGLIVDLATLALLTLATTVVVFGLLVLAVACVLS
jgi:hypothetical protein